MMLVSSTVLADGGPTTAPAATAVDTIKGYWRCVKAGKADDGVLAYIDTGAMIEAVANKDPVLTAEQHAAAEADIRRLVSAAWQNPQLQDMIKDSDLTIKSQKIGHDGVTVVDYVVTIHRPQEGELDNTVYVRKSGHTWHIVDMRKADGQPITETVRNAWQRAHQAEPSLTFNEFIRMMADSVAGKNTSRSPTTQK
jgi:hypothetical protein